MRVGIACRPKFHPAGPAGQFPRSAGAITPPREYSPLRSWCNRTPRAASIPRSSRAMAARVAAAADLGRHDGDGQALITQERHDELDGEKRRVRDRASAEATVKAQA
jgi:hypothetical protein